MLGQERIITNLELVDPTPTLAAEFRAMAAEWRDDGEDRFKDAFDDFDAYVTFLEISKEARNLPPNRVPSSTYWLVVNGDRIVGTSRLRHWLVPHLEKEGGHIGYNIRPSERRQGFGTVLLALVLEKAIELGLQKVIVTCDRDNEASIRIIEKNGGQMMGVGISKDSGKEVSRYRIILVRQMERLPHAKGN